VFPTEANIYYSPGVKGREPFNLPTIDYFAFTVCVKCSIKLTADTGIHGFVPGGGLIFPISAGTLLQGACGVPR